MVLVKTKEEKHQRYEPAQADAAVSQRCLCDVGGGKRGIVVQ